MRFVKSLAVATLAMLACSAAMALDGGYKNTNTGLVWSDSLRALANGTSADWPYATNYAANYAVWDVNDNGVLTYYSDWRLPTQAELQAALTDGTVQYINQNSPSYRFLSTDRYFWTSTTRGNKAWLIHIRFGASGEVVSWDGNWATKNMWLVEAYMVRP